MALKACMYLAVGFEGRIPSMHIAARGTLRIGSIAGLTGLVLEL